MAFISPCGARGLQGAVDGDDYDPLFLDAASIIEDTGLDRAGGGTTAGCIERRPARLEHRRRRPSNFLALFFIDSRPRSPLGRRSETGMRTTEQGIAMAAVAAVLGLTGCYQGRDDGSRLPPGQADEGSGSGSDDGDT
ncbi:MAG: hypothetical protein H6712_34790, partial [Myxococcales bacterium]|nr:hypothetical protein [Myxococcales bacterium]